MIRTKQPNGSQTHPGVSEKGRGHIGVATEADRQVLGSVKHQLRRLIRNELDSEEMKALFFAKLLHYLKSKDFAEKLRINTRTGYLLINVNEIVFCKAAGNYTEITLGENKKEIATMNLSKTTNHLQGNAQFKRVGRSLLINTNYLYKVDRAKKVCVLEKNGVSFMVDIPDKYLNSLELQ